MSTDLIKRLRDALYAMQQSALQYKCGLKICDDAIAEADAHLKNGGWVRVEDALPQSGVPVLVAIERDSGKRLVLRADYAADKSLEMNIECDGGIYDEETDTFWCEAGWYESNDKEEIHWAITEEILGWQPLPQPLEQIK